MKATAEKRHVKVRYLDKDKLSKLCSSRPHQGVLLKATRHPSINCKSYKHFLE